MKLRFSSRGRSLAREANEKEEEERKKTTKGSTSRYFFRSWLVFIFQAFRRVTVVCFRIFWARLG